MDVSRNCSRVLRIQIARDLRTPSVQGAMSFAMYAIFMIPAVVFVEPTGPTMSSIKFCPRRNGMTDGTGLNFRFATRLSLFGAELR